MQYLRQAQERERERRERERESEREREREREEGRPEKLTPGPKPSGGSIPVNGSKNISVCLRRLTK